MTVGTSRGISKGVIYRGEKVEVSWSIRSKARVSRTDIVNVNTGEVLVPRKTS